MYYREPEGSKNQAALIHNIMIINGRTLLFHTFPQINQGQLQLSLDYCRTFRIFQMNVLIKKYHFFFETNFFEKTKYNNNFLSLIGSKGQSILKQITKRTQDSILSVFCLFWEKLWLDNFVSRSYSIMKNFALLK